MLVSSVKSIWTKRFKKAYQTKLGVSCSGFYSPKIKYVVSNKFNKQSMVMIVSKATLNLTKTEQNKAWYLWDGLVVLEFNSTQWNGRTFTDGANVYSIKSTQQPV